MRNGILFPLLTALLLWPFAGRSASARVSESFDADWHFFQGDPAGAQQPRFKDLTWRGLDLPNDWSIAGPFCKTNPAGGAGVFLPTGVAWYREHFTLPASDETRCVFIQFGGVMANSDVWINGYHLGHRPYGYVSFQYELTGHLNFGGDNVIAVRCDTSKQPASRWNAGSGIYRHVWLVVTSPIHFARDGVFISTPRVSANEATIKIETELTNESAANVEFTLQTRILGPDDKWAGAEMTDNGAFPAHGEGGYTRNIVVTNPQLWDLDTPKLYRVVSKLVSHGECLDEITNAFGIRDAHFEAATGFWLNGKNFKIKGVCLHAGGGAFGAAVPLDVWRQRLAELRKLGVNTIRTAHNPPAPEFLDLCDQMGFLVMDEFFDCWTVGKNRYDYHLYFRQWSHTDERDAILRDRNHPSIIIYSVGNEIHDTPHQRLAKGILKGLIAVAHQTDPTRPVTMALFRPNASHDYEDGLADMLDVVGQNYRENEILAARAQKPSRKILGTENTLSRQAWLALRDNPPYAGQFLWSGVDYLGESRHWPIVGHGSGLLDRTGRAKPEAFQRESWWSDRPMVFMARRVAPTDAMPVDPGYGGLERYRQALFADWTPRELAPHEETVEVYSNCKQVELLLNGKSLGSQGLPADASPRVWKMNFAPGTLKAVARDEEGDIVAADELRTAGEPAKITLSTETHALARGFDHVAEVRAKITDRHGIEIPDANNLISFTVSGPGEVAAVDNGDNASHEPFQAAERHAYEGECVAFVRATSGSGEIKLSASAKGLEDGSITIRAVQ
ncbi:MAG: glycoside hydrolase family 2 TIM barrel-domain containing protein [Limisphaerales bacterium]